ncbi:MAG: hypothetical protein ACF8AM_22160 [Rhodopirellula sp. JB055]|uniref:hypothetical protein n=1 Tax=Rhodopirellula sp. JB055 TaxID=3342846 RepID=UPI00370A3208
MNVFSILSSAFQLVRRSPGHLAKCRVWYVTLLFWAFALLLSAGGHRAFVSLRSLDQSISSVTYQQQGRHANWVGHGTAAHSLEYKQKVDPSFVEASKPSSLGDLRTLTVSTFWAGLAIALTAGAAIAVWAGGRVPANGIQSLIGALAGHALWIGAIEVGLDIAARKLGLAGALAVVEDRVVGVHGTGVLIQWSALFLIPVMIGLTFHESNRCVVFKWLRKRLPLTRSVAPSGRVENYAARTLVQFFMTVWVCYAGILWAADRSFSPYPGATLTIAMLLIAIATPYMVYRTTQQKSAAAMFRYSVSGAVVAWSGIEIAAATRLITEPWLSDSALGLVVWVASPILLTVFVVRALLVDRSESSRQHDPPCERGVRKEKRAFVTVAMLMSLTPAFVGCSSEVPEEAPLTSEQMIQRLDEIAEPLKPVPEEAMEGVAHALGTPDRIARVSAILACGKSKRVPRYLRASIFSIAQDDPDPLVRGAALRCLWQLGRPTSELRRLTDELRDDVVFGDLIKQFQRE